MSLEGILMKYLQENHKVSPVNQLNFQDRIDSRWRIECRIKWNNYVFIDNIIKKVKIVMDPGLKIHLNDNIVEFILFHETYIFKYCLQDC